jgi:hypothetical protein
VEWQSLSLSQLVSYPVGMTDVGIVANGARRLREALARRRDEGGDEAGVEEETAPGDTPAATVPDLVRATKDRRTLWLR